MNKAMNYAAYVCLSFDPNDGYECSHENCVSLLKTAYADIYGDKMPDIIRDENGKPHFRTGGLFLSVSHCSGLSAVALAECDIGIDAESAGRKLPGSVAEKCMIGSISDWTHLEAYGKLMGRGLADALGGMKIRHCVRQLDVGGFVLSVCSFDEISLSVRIYDRSGGREQLKIF